MADIIITEFIDDAAVATIPDTWQLHRDDSLAEKPDELAQLLGTARALIIRNKTQITSSLLDAAPSLQVIGRLGVGLDNIDMDACQARGITVCPAFGANAASVAEYVIAALLQLRRPVFSRVQAMLEGGFPRQLLSQAGEIGSMTLGLLGYGTIAREVARRALAMDMRVIAFDPAIEQAATGSEAAVELVSMEKLLAEADAISLHVPLTAETRDLISAKTIAMMRHGALLINTARGEVVDLQAVADALDSGQLGGVALDVFKREPADAALLAPLAGLDASVKQNLLLTPHIAGLTGEANWRVSMMTVENVLRVLGDVRKGDVLEGESS